MRLERSGITEHPREPISLVHVRYYVPSLTDRRSCCTFFFPVPLRAVMDALRRPAAVPAARQMRPSIKGVRGFRVLPGSLPLRLHAAWS